jgi:hypothetical protein
VSRTTRETRLVAWASDMFQQISTVGIVGRGLGGFGDEREHKCWI